MLGQPAPPPQQPKGSTTDTKPNPRDHESMVDVSTDPPAEAGSKMVQRNRLLAALPVHETWRSRSPWSALKAWPAYPRSWAPRQALIGASARSPDKLFDSTLSLCADSW